jgi:FKBP-type peptidyl-prolyl cis-trans isomerase
MIRTALSCVFCLGALLWTGGCPQPPPDGNGDAGDLTPQASVRFDGDQVNVGDTVVLASQVSAASDGAGFTYRWFQVFGRAVNITNADAAEASFVAPSLPKAQTLRFRVDVIASDGTPYPSNTVDVTVSGDDNYVAPDSGDGGGAAGNVSDAAWEEQVLIEGEAELAKSDETRAQEFASLIDNAQDNAGNLLQETASGLKYVAVLEGAGGKPTESDTVRVHYSGWLLDDGSTFDSSIERGQPSTFGLTQVIDGWTEGLQLMRVGAHYRFVIPPGLAYGSAGNPPTIPESATLVFDVYLLGIE